jgi:hypothetical protein
MVPNGSNDDSRSPNKDRMPVSAACILPTDLAKKRTPETGSEEPKASKYGVVVTFAADQMLASFQQWEASMATMEELQLRSKLYCAETGKGGEQKAVSPSDIIGAADQAVGLAKDVVSLFAVNQSIAGVSGTIMDQALVASVARQLRAINVAVVIPGSYSPYTLGGLDASKSPFLTNFEKLIQTRICLQAVKLSKQATIDKDALAKAATEFKSISDQLNAYSQLPPEQQTSKKAEIDQLRSRRAAIAQQISDGNATQDDVASISGIISGIDSFIAFINGGSAAPTAASSTGKQAMPTGNTEGSTTTPPSDKPTSDVAGSIGVGGSPSLPSILAADGLAAKIGVGPACDLQSSTWRLLSLKALESGGAMLTKSSLIGSKVFVSGGAVLIAESLLV